MSYPEWVAYWEDWATKCEINYEVDIGHALATKSTWIMVMICMYKSPRIEIRIVRIRSSDVTISTAFPLKPSTFNVAFHLR